MVRKAYSSTIPNFEGWTVGLEEGQPERPDPRIRTAFDDCDVDAIGQISLH